MKNRYEALIVLNSQGKEDSLNCATFWPGIIPKNKQHSSGCAPLS